jgi:hypothetical protein
MESLIEINDIVILHLRHEIYLFLNYYNLMTILIYMLSNY